MKLNFRISFICLLTPFLVFSQEEDSDVNLTNYVQEDPETVFFNVGFFKPIAIGDNSFAKAYQSPDTGFELDFNWLAYANFTAGFRIDLFYAGVEDISKIGAIAGTRLTNYTVHLGYYKAITKKWNWHANLGIGSVGYRSRTYDDVIREYGWNLSLQNEVNYRFNQYFGLYGKLQLRADFLDINSAKPKEDFLNKQFFLVPGIGIRVNFHNPEG
ncbi:MAG: hypothetical protein R3218_04300 [Christiangramia sp.]|nr:hypothetical protein [Christiangramia sp.]